MKGQLRSYYDEDLGRILMKPQSTYKDAAYAERVNSEAI